MKGVLKRPKCSLVAALTAASALWMVHRQRKYPLEREYGLASCMLLPRWVASLPAARLGNAILKRLPLPEVSIGVTRSRRWIPTEDGRPMPLTIFDGTGGLDDAPCLIYFHGGAFLFEAAPYIYCNVAELARMAQCKVVMVHYRTAEHKAFPGPFFDCRAALWYTWQHHAELGIDPTRMAVGGDSAGAALAAACSLWARDETELDLCFQLLIYPVTDARMADPALCHDTDTPLWNAILNRRMWKLYLRDGVPLTRGYASPMEALDHRRLPAAYIEVAAFDCLRAEGLAYAAVLRHDGASVQLEQPAGTFHGFDAFQRAPMRQWMLLKRARALRCAFARATKDNRLDAQTPEVKR